ASRPKTCESRWRDAVRPGARQALSANRRRRGTRMAGHNRADPNHHRSAQRRAALHAADLRQARRGPCGGGVQGRRRGASGLVSEPVRAAGGDRAGAGRPVQGPRPDRDRRGEARPVGDDERPLAGLRRVPAQDRAGHPGGRTRARGVNRPGEDWSARRLHFVGIGGAGMSGLALIARGLGAAVTGSDRAESSYTARLREHGIEPVLGHRAENVPAGAEVVYSTAVPPDNPERRAAGDHELHRSELLAQIAAAKRCLAVTGTHGKTTTAAMLVHILEACGLDPAYVVGGELRGTGANAGWGQGDWIVVEADESDRSLLALHPDIALLTNAELDHHATYSSRLDLEATLSEFMGRAKTGAVVWDRPALRALCPPDALAYDAPDTSMHEHGSRLHWRGIE